MRRGYSIKGQCGVINGKTRFKGWIKIKEVMGVKYDDTSDAYKRIFEEVGVIQWLQGT